MIEPANAEEIHVITTLWIETFASEDERRDRDLRARVSHTAERILRGEARDTTGYPSALAWRALPPMLAAYRAGKRGA